MRTAKYRSPTLPIRGIVRKQMHVRNMRHCRHTLLLMVPAMWFGNILYDELRALRARAWQMVSRSVVSVL
jgi:hypothetical protein